jgi:pilus assembly protein CpaF
MALLDRIFRDDPPPEEVDAQAQDSPIPAEPESDPEDDRALSPEYQEIKSRVHNQLFEYIDFGKLAEVSEARIAGDIATLARRILSEDPHPFTHTERERIVQEVQHEVFGLGPLEPLLSDPGISDILVNGPDQVFVERSGQLTKTIVRFKDDAHLMRIIERILAGAGRRIDELTPYADARLPDGSRVHTIIPPLAIDGPTISIRRFAVDPLDYRDLIDVGTITPECAMILHAVVRSRLNVLISGGTGCGKTTLLNVLSGFIPANERVVTIEDSAELQLKQEHVVRLETRPPNVEGRGEVTQRDLVINSLRMRPDRIVIGEVRGGEALDMLQAMNTGHDGSLTTIHANSPIDAVARIETMVAMSGLSLTTQAVNQQIGSAIDVIVQLTRFSDGARRLLSLVEVQSDAEGKIQLKEIFRFRHDGTDEQGRTHGEIICTGERPDFLERFELARIDYPRHLFDEAKPADPEA